MSNERYLVTGAAGCIGAWVLRNLVTVAEVEALVAGNVCGRVSR